MGQIDGFKHLMTQIKKKLALYIFQHFEIVKTIKELYGFVDYFFERIIYASKDDEIIGVAVYLWLNDDALSLIRDKPLILASVEEFKKIEEMKGDNMHFFGVATREPKLILKGIKQIIKDKKPRTISWLNQDMSRFVCFKGVR